MVEGGLPSVPILFHETEVGTSGVRTLPSSTAAYHTREVPGPGSCLRQRVRLATAAVKPQKPCILRIMS